MTKLITHDGSAFEGYEVVKVTPRPELSKKLIAYKDRVRLFQRKIECNLWQFHLFIKFTHRYSSYDEFWLYLSKFLRERAKLDSWRFIARKEKLFPQGADLLLSFPCHGTGLEFIKNLQDNMALFINSFFEFDVLDSDCCNIFTKNYERAAIPYIRCGGKMYYSRNLRNCIPDDPMELVKDLYQEKAGEVDG